jgi:hypothetical protein
MNTADTVLSQSAIKRHTLTVIVCAPAHSYWSVHGVGAGAM